MAVQKNDFIQDHQPHQANNQKGDLSFCAMLHTDQTHATKIEAFGGLVLPINGDIYQNF